MLYFNTQLLSEAVRHVAEHRLNGVLCFDDLGQRVDGVGIEAEGVRAIDELVGTEHTMFYFRC